MARRSEPRAWLAGALSDVDHVALLPHGVRLHHWREGVVEEVAGLFVAGLGLWLRGKRERNDSGTFCQSSRRIGGWTPVGCTLGALYVTRRACMYSLGCKAMMCHKADMRCAYSPSPSRSRVSNGHQGHPRVERWAARWCWNAWARV